MPRDKRRVFTRLTRTMTDKTLMKQRGIVRRMNVDGQVARIIVDTFTTVENLMEAVETYDDLTKIEGIGPKTANAIEDWWEVRYERERQITQTEVERTGNRSATIHFFNSWEDALGMDA